MDIVVVGMDHRFAPMEVREAVAFTKREIGEGIDRLKNAGELEPKKKKKCIREVVILSTCNRSEIYAATENPDRAIDIIKDFYLSEKTPEAQTYLYSYAGREAVRHLFRVVAGLDSMILGEDQILGQSKDALALAQKYQGAGKYLTKAFREAVTFSKKVKNVYKISETPLSLSSTAVKHIKRLYPDDFADKKVMVIGTGKMGMLAIQYLDAEGFHNVTVTNRTQHSPESYEKTLKNLPHLRVVPFPDRYDYIGDMDVIISATAAPHKVLTADDFPTPKKSQLLVDLALPRDIDEAIADDDNVTLITIDDFNHIIDETKAYREKVAKKIAAQVGDAVDELMLWIDKSKVDGLVGELNKMAMTRTQETVEILNKRYQFTGKDKKFLDKIVKSEFRKMVHPAIMKLKAMDDQDEIAKCRDVINELFEVDA